MRDGWKVRRVASNGLLACAGLLLTSGLMAQTAPAAQPAVPELLWPGGAPLAQGADDLDKPTITVYLPAQNPTRTAVIIAPGGGYGHLSMEKEGSDVARWLNAHGVAGVVLKYRLSPKYHHPVELGDALRAIRAVRSRAASLGVAPDHVGIWGFSAGGHLAASAATLYDTLHPAGDAIDALSARPDFVILAYPVITMDERFAHVGSRNNLLGEHATPEQVAALSTELHVTAQTPPTFLFATSDDPVVPVKNSVVFYSALIENKVPAEMHLFAHGPHGVGLAPGFPDLRSWPELLATWLRARGLMGPATP